MQELVGGFEPAAREAPRSASGRGCPIDAAAHIRQRDAQAAVVNDVKNMVT